MAYRLLDNGLVLLGIPCSSLLSGSQVLDIFVNRHAGFGYLIRSQVWIWIYCGTFLGLGLEMVNHSGQGILEVQHALLDGLELRVLGDGLVDVYISNSSSVPSSKEMA